MGNFLRSFKHAISGLAYFFKNERNAKVHLIIATGVIIASFLLKINYLEWALTLLSLRGIFTQEIANSAFEDLANIVQPNFDEKIGLAKDKSAGRVLMAGLFLLAIEIIVLGPKIIVLVEKLFS